MLIAYLALIVSVALIFTLSPDIRVGTVGEHSPITLRRRQDGQGGAGKARPWRLLHIHPKTLQRMARLLAIPGHQIGKQWRFRASELDSWLKSAVSSQVPFVPLK